MSETPQQAVQRLLAAQERLLAEATRIHCDTQALAASLGVASPQPHSTGPVAPGPHPQAPDGAAVASVPVTRPSPSGSPPVSPPPPIQAGMARPAGQPAPAFAPAQPRQENPAITARVLGGLGAAVTIAGVAFLLVLAAQRGWYGPPARVATAAALSVALIVAGFVVRRRRPENPGAPALVAAGLASGFVAVVAATTIYQWLPPLAGLVLDVVLGLAMVAVALLWRSQWLAVTTVALSLCAALFLGDLRLAVIFMVALTGVTSVVSRWVRWPWFLLARFAPTVAAIEGLILSVAPDGSDVTTWGVSDAWLLTFAAITVLAVAVLTTILDSTAAAGGSERTIEAWVIVVAGTLAPQALGFVFPANWTTGAVLIGVAVAAVGLAVSRRLSAAATGALVAVSWTYLVIAVTGFQGLGWVLVAMLALAAAVIAGFTTTRTHQIVAATLMIAVLVVWLFPAGALMLGLATGSGPLASSLVLLAGCLASGWLLSRTRPATSRWWYAVVAGVVLTSSVAVEAVTIAIAWALQPGDTGQRVGFMIGSAIVTVLWVAAAVVSLSLAFRRGPHAVQLVRIGLGLSIAAVVKLVLVDLAGLTPLIRGLAFLGSGVLLLVVGLQYAKASQPRPLTASGSPTAPEPPTGPGSPGSWPPAASGPPFPPPTGVPTVPAAPVPHAGGGQSWPPSPASPPPSRL